MGLHCDWGRRPYAEIHDLQRRLVALRAEERVPDLLLTGEHDPVVTLGRRSPPGPFSLEGIPTVVVERGGEATYHGPGQLIAYPIVHLGQARRNLHAFQRDLEEIGIRTLADLGIQAVRRPGLTGVWVDDQKVMSLGIAVRRWVSWHGIALNLSPDLEPFRRFRPCGLDGSVMTSVAKIQGTAPEPAVVLRRLVAHAGQLLPGGPFPTGSLPAVLDGTIGR